MMKKLFVVGLIGLMGLMGNMLHAQTDWKKTEKLIYEGSYKEAYAQAEAVYKKSQSSPELLTAAWYMSRIATEYQENSYDSAVAHYRAILPRLEAPERAVCYAFLGVVDSALLDEDVLKKTSSDRIRHFCSQEGDEGVNVTPTVYDVVVMYIIQEKKEFFFRDDQKECMAWIQRLVDFHSNDSEELRMSLDLLMLDVMEGSYDNHDADYNEKTLQGYIDKYRGSKNPTLTLFYNIMAGYLGKKERYVEAVNYCDTAIALAPESEGGANCANMKNGICAARIYFTASRANASAFPDQPSLHRLSYRNLNRVYLSVYPFEGGDKNDFFANLPKPVEKWQLEVTDDGSHHLNNIYFEVPALPSGRYLLVASPDGKVDKRSAYIELFCTEMEVSKTDSIFQLFDARNGTPIVGQRMDFYKDTDSLYSGYTDADGRLLCRGATMGSNIGLKIKRGGYLYKSNGYFGYYPSRRKMVMQMNLMSDRPIYRPGDTIRFAALCFEADGLDGRVLPDIQGTFVFRDPNGKERDTLGFTTDGHGLASAFFVIPADALGGSWRLQCRAGDRKESISVRVEEYKQPKFMVSIDAKQEGAAEPPAFGKPFTLRGMARAYNGTSLAGAQVSYTIRRMPYGNNWWDWAENNYYDYSSETEPVVSDTIEVSADGTFDITYTPEPDSSIELSIKPNFHFFVLVEVTDLNGETHAANTDFRVGFQNRELFLMGVADNTSSLASVSYSLSDLNFNPLKGTVNVTVQRLAAATPLLRHPVYSGDDETVCHTLTREQFHEHFPGFYYTYDEVNPALRAVEWTYTVSHTADGIVSTQNVPLPAKKMKSGLYRIVVSIDDLADTTYTTLILPDERRMHQSADELAWADFSTTSCEVGDRLTLRYASAFDDVRIFYTLMGPDGKEHDSRWLPASSTIKHLSVPVDTSLLGGFTVRLTAMKNGILNTWTRKIDVPFTHKKLDVDIATFRDKLLPGEEEEWTIKINTPQSTLSTSHALLSTIIMTMFDDALSSYGSSYGSWSLPSWRHNSCPSMIWQFPNYSHDAYDGSLYFEHLDGYSKEPVVLMLQRGLFRSKYYLNAVTKNVRNNAVATASVQDESDAVDNATVGVLKGTITDEKTKEEIPFVNVVVKQDGKQVLAGATDFDGVYTIKPLKEGTYDIEVTAVGYQSYKKTGIRVKTSGFTVVDVQLYPSATNLEEICIESEKVPIIEIGAPESGQRLSSEDIQHMPGNSVESIVAEVGGLGYSDGGTMKQSVQVRTNLNTYAFFVAGLHTDSAGIATYRFTVPELLTRWRVKGFAYTDDLKSGTLERTLVTQKPLMVQPNIPRFLRHGDSIVLMAKVMNLTDNERRVQIEFNLKDANGGDFLIRNHRIASVPAQGSLQVSFPIDRLPDDLFVATYEIVVRTLDDDGVKASLSDGERGQIPVVSDRQAVTLSQPLYINGKGEKSFHFPLSTLHSPTATPHLLAAELVSNPVWLAIKSMPYLKQQANPSTLYLANSLYVNTLAKEIIDNFHFQFSKLNLTDTANTRLKINEDVKQTLLEATPWLRDAEAEAEQRQAIAHYFDSTALSQSISQTISLLQERQNSDGGWSWMPDGESSPWVTMQVLKRLSILKQSDNPTCSAGLRPTWSKSIKQSLSYVDKEEQRHYERYIKPYLKKYQWEPDNIEYLYTRSYYGKGTTEAYKFYYKNALKNYRKYSGLYTQAQLALIFQRHGDKKAARDLIRRLKEKSLTSDEMGMYWRDNRGGWCWYERPIETQALIIQAFREVTPNDTASIALMQQWLLKQKQTTHWGNDRATVEAISALVTDRMGQTDPVDQTGTLSLSIFVPSLQGEGWGRGSHSLFATPLTPLERGDESGALEREDEGKPLDEKGSGEGLEGYHSQRWTGATLDSIIALGDSTITLRKTTPGIAWGAVYLQYTDDIDKIPSSQSGITLKRTYVGANNQLPMRVGDRVTVRIEISCDRTMEYLELIDGRPSCVEPLSTRSGWCWNQGLSYYVDIKNTATHCYINRLEKGKYMVEYEVYVTNPGTFLAGPVTLQCMYAPEFRATAPAQRFVVD